MNYISIFYLTLPNISYIYHINKSQIIDIYSRVSLVFYAYIILLPLDIYVFMTS
jgi:hypothetical protein